MASVLPSRLLTHNNGVFYVFNPHDRALSPRPVISHFDIISYTWGSKEPKYVPDIHGVTWEVEISRGKLEEIKRFMIAAGVQYLWVDCVCINQESEEEKSAEIVKMYDYYKAARKCHILLNLAVVWNPDDIIDDLKFVDHVLSHISAKALSVEARLTQSVMARLLSWADAPWLFPLEKGLARSSGIDVGLLNCYSTSISHVRSLFDNLYFSRVWTFQEMLLGKNITMWGINSQRVQRIGEFSVWMDLATDAKDRAYKLLDWIQKGRVVRSTAVNAVMGVIEDDTLALDLLQTRVQGISSAREDIIHGGPYWWQKNLKGTSNVFSAVSIRPRYCEKRADVFRGLLGIFNGLFTPEEVKNYMMGDDIDALHFHFFRQLSIKTEIAWTRLAISSRERGEWDWIPVSTTHGEVITTDCFAGVIALGRLRPGGLCKAEAMTGIKGFPRRALRVELRREKRRGFHFEFRGCNCGRLVKTDSYTSEPIPEHNSQPRQVHRDETASNLVQCATILGSILDPGGNVVDYRRRLLRKLWPVWRGTDAAARRSGWIDRCVSGTFWEDPDPREIRPHNQTLNLDFGAIESCDSRLENRSTRNIACNVTIAGCGCEISLPFAFFFEGLTALEGSFLGDVSASLDKANRIVLHDGLGLVQPSGDIGRAFHLVAFSGDNPSIMQREYASACRRTKVNKPVLYQARWPCGRALVREEFTHRFSDMMRDYGYVETGGSGNLLICRDWLMDNYRIIGVCIDEFIANRKGKHSVTIC